MLRRLALSAALALGAGGCALVNASDSPGGDPDGPDDDDPVDPIDDEDDDPNAGGFLLVQGEDGLDKPSALAVRDVAGDPAPDVAVLDVAAQRAYLYVNDGTAHFREHSLEVQAAGWMFAGTYLDDGDTMPGRDLAYVADSGQLAVVDGDGEGGLVQRSASLAVAPVLMAPYGVPGGGDGMLMIDTSGAFVLLHPVGTGQFGADPGPNPPPVVPRNALRSADVDGDGDADVMLAADDSVFIALEEAGTLLPWDDLIDLDLDEGTVVDAAVGDFIGGAAPDVAALTEGTGLPSIAFLELVEDEFFVEEELDPGVTATSMRVGDADGDGRPDLFLVGAQVSVLLAGAARDYSERIDIDSIPSHEVAVADFDGDGRDDVAVVSGDQADGSLQVWCSRIPPPE